MKIQKKIYRCNTHFLSTIIKVKGREMRIVFENGGYYNGTETKGTYSTINPEIQAAIENDSRFGKTIKLFNTIVVGNIPDRTAPITALQVYADKQPEKSSVMISFENETYPECTIGTKRGAEKLVTEEQRSDNTPITNIAALKEILSGIPYNIPLSRLNNKKKILAEATTAGISFDIQ